MGNHDTAPAELYLRYFNDVKACEIFEKTGIILAGIGKASFPEADLKANFDALVDAIVKAKPSGAKGKYVQKLALTSTMGPGVRVDLTEIAGA